MATLNFVPHLGALTGIICMTLGAVLSFDSFGYAMLFPASYLVLATLEGNFITPLVLEIFCDHIEPMSPIGEFMSRSRPGDNICHFLR